MEQDAGRTTPERRSARERALPAAARDLLSRVRLITASNRGPVEFSLDQDGNFSTRRGAGGVVTAISAIGRYTDTIWVASAMTEGDRARALLADDLGEEVIAPPDTDFRLRFVVSDPAAYDGYYNRIANPLLWFLQHYLWDTPRAPDVDYQTWEAWHDGYVVVNEEFADEILRVADASTHPPLVMLQDYHLYLVPRLLRAARPDMILQQFVHIPWPDPDYWRLIPGEMRRAICESLLANDIVGFQTPGHARSFMYTCEANLPDVDIGYRTGQVDYRGRTTQVRAYPISIDVDAVLAVAESEDARRHAELVQGSLNDYTVVRVDRAEPSKNIVRGFLAYDRMLEEHPDLIGRVNFLAYLVPSRLEVTEYVDYLDDINTVVGRIATKYANVAQTDGVAWQPIHVFIGDDYPRALAAMRHYDALLVNPIFDGMNLVAKEGALLNERDGVLVLSEGAGAYQQLGAHALSVAPTDIEGTARALYAALTMPAGERAAHARALRQLVLDEDILTWIYSQLEDLATTPAGRGLIHR
ncbi:MAG TPA: trehalose-6-phosphate synthase [Thermomicrobiaceae bacterium]|nr:trehalose-6-phosphate synthase [Thermomicrobiaceae bacterium]